MPNPRERQQWLDDLQDAAKQDDDHGEGSYVYTSGTLDDILSDHENEIRKKIADELRAEAERIERDG